jgi:hypothetical protein
MTLMMLKMTLIAGILAMAASREQNIDRKVETPFFCNLKALTPAERTEHQQLTERLAETILNTVEIADGYAFEIDGHRVSIRDLAQWTEFERRCCPFFDFNLEWRRENGPVTLRLTGRDGVKQFIRAEFSRIIR